MEAIIKINRHTAMAVETMTTDSFMFSFKLADEGEGQQEAQEVLELLKANRVVDHGYYTYLYMPCLPGRQTGETGAVCKPQTVTNL